MDIESQAGVEELRARRQARGLTLADLARQLGITSASLSRIERGLQWPNRELHHKLSVWFSTGEIDVDAPE